MSTFVPLPLGQRIPPALHAVSCSLPTMSAVIGYEERDPAVISQMTSGYPRFVIHPFVRQLTELFRGELELGDQTLWLAVSARAADDLAAELGSAYAVRVRHDGLHGVALPGDPELNQRAKVFLQNTGGFLGSREAEDHLVRRGLYPRVEPETTVSERALDRVTTQLLQAYPGAEATDVILAPSGMNAFAAAWRTLADLQASRGRTIWIQLGWLYLDTMALLKRSVLRPADHVYLPDPTNLAAVQAACAAAGDRLAGLVTEAPTNPLVQTPNLAALRSAVHEQGGRLLIDPSLVSALNISVLPHADVVVNSLTKYAASEGDVIAGAVIINPHGPDAAYLRKHIARRADPIYRRDLERLAAQIGDFEAVVSRTNASTAQVIEFLRQHPRVREVYWSLQPSCRDNYVAYARSPAHIGALLSFTVRPPLAEVYDRLRLPKGPSFGMKTTLICPFIFLAHYDLVTTEAGREQLAHSGIDPELLRLSVGCEPVEEIISALAEALA
jgi:cystathionine gamma-synthase